MRSCLLLINVLMVMCHLTCRAQDAVPDSVVSSEYTLFMQARGHELTGICVVSYESEDSITGTIVNEFGVKVFDFVMTGDKAKVFNVIKPLDRWYIRRVLRGDVNFIFRNIRQGENRILKKRSITFQENGDIKVENSRYRIRYIFTPIQTSDETDK